MLSSETLPFDDLTIVLLDTLDDDKRQAWQTVFPGSTVLQSAPALTPYAQLLRVLAILPKSTKRLIVPPNGVFPVRAQAVLDLFPPEGVRLFRKFNLCLVGKVGVDGLRAPVALTLDAAVGEALGGAPVTVTAQEIVPSGRVDVPVWKLPAEIAFVRLHLLSQSDKAKWRAAMEDVDYDV